MNVFDTYLTFAEFVEEVRELFYVSLFLARIPPGTYVIQSSIVDLECGGR